MKTHAQQLYPPEPPLSFPPIPRSALAEQHYPPEPPLSFPPHAEDRGLRADAQALKVQDNSRLSVGQAKFVDPSQLYMTGGLLLVVVGVLLFAVARRKKETNKKDSANRSVAFADSYEPFLG